AQSSRKQRCIDLLQADAPGEAREIGADLHILRRGRGTSRRRPRRSAGRRNECAQKDNGPAHRPAPFSLTLAAERRVAEVLVVVVALVHGAMSQFEMGHKIPSRKSAVPALVPSVSTICKPRRSMSPKSCASASLRTRTGSPSRSDRASEVEFVP